MRIRNGRYIFAGFGGRKPGYVVRSETRKKIRDGVLANNKTSRIYLHTHKHEGINKCHGDAFRMAFDERFGILYIDLKMISGACGMME